MQRAIAFKKSNAILYNHIHITQLPSTRHMYALANIIFVIDMVMSCFLFFNF